MYLCIFLITNLHWINKEKIVEKNEMKNEMKYLFLQDWLIVSLQFCLCSLMIHVGLERGQKSLPLSWRRRYPEWRASRSREFWADQVTLPWPGSRSLFSTSLPFFTCLLLELWQWQREQLTIILCRKMLCDQSIHPA